MKTDTQPCADGDGGVSASQGPWADPRPRKGKIFSYRFQKEPPDRSISDFWPPEPGDDKYLLASICQDCPRSVFSPGPLPSSLEDATCNRVS